MSLQKAILFLLASLAVIFICGFTFFEKNTVYKFSGLEFFPPLPHTDNPPTVEGAALGRFLFYDSILSKNRKISCGTCHKQAHAFSDAPNQFSKGIDKKILSRNTLPLFNLAWYPTLFWDGKALNIEEQVFHPVQAHNEMNLNWTTAVRRIKESKFYAPQFKRVFGTTDIDSMMIARAIGQFERTLISNNSKYDQTLRGKAFFTAEEYEGFELINDQTKGDCLHCHTTDADVLGTTAKFSNNGLDGAFSSEGFKDIGRGGVTRRGSDIGKFKIPSLRNVALTSPYMHDGRFATLEEVINFYSEGVNNSLNIDSKMGFVHKGGAHLSEDEKEKILSFLHTLTDSVFISDPAFSNPFK